ARPLYGAMPRDRPRGLRRSRADRYRCQPIRRRDSSRAPRCARHDRGARDRRPAHCRDCFSGLPSAPSAANKTAGPACAQLHSLACGAFWPCRFAIGGKVVEIEVYGSLIANEASLLVQAALGGAGVLYVLEEFAALMIAAGQLVPLLEAWLPRSSE